MGNKKVCNYCGTVYSEQQEQCPLCGGTDARIQQDTAPQREPRERRNGKGAYLSQKPKKKKKQRAAKQDDGGIPSRFLTIASVLLGLAIVCMTWHILYKCNAIGWSPLGFLSESNKAGKSYDESDEFCWYLNINADEVRLTEEGQSMTLEVDIRPENCTEPIEFTTDKPTVATVDQNGKITAVSEGVAYISVTCGSITRRCEVTCAFDQESSSDEPDSSDDNEEPVSSDSGSTLAFKPILNYTDITMTSVGEQVYFKVKNLQDGMEVTWTSDNDSVCTVDENGVATAVGKGTTNIRATVNGRTAFCIVRCERLPEAGSPEVGYHLSHTDVTLSSSGETFRLRLLDGDGNAVSGATYTCDDTAVCTVDANGTVTAVANGTATVKVVSGGATYTCIVRVNIRG